MKLGFWGIRVFDISTLAGHVLGAVMLSALALLPVFVAIPVHAEDSDAHKQVTLLLPQLRIEGLTEYPEHGITTASLHRDVFEVLSSYKQQISMQCLQDIASRITSRYRAEGFVFTRAYIPAQHSSDGVVVIRLLEGWLSDVDVYDNVVYDSPVLLAPFASLKGKVLYSPDVEEALALVNDMPGVDAFGFFSIGDEVGSTRINLRIKREKRWSAGLRTDNHGSPLTGELRTLANVEWFNPTGIADVLRLGVLHSYQPENASFGFIGYQRPLGGQLHSIGIEASADQYDLGKRGTPTYDVFRISGESQSLRINYRRQLHKRSDDTAAWLLEARYSEADSNSAEFPDAVDLNRNQRDWLLQWQWQQSASSRKSGIWWQWQSGIGTGRYADGKPEQQSADFYLASFSGSLGGPMKWLDAIGAHRWYVEIDSQFSEDLLPATQQFSLTGASRARGFEPGVFVGDTGGSLRVAWQPPIRLFMPWWKDKAWLSAFSVDVFAEEGYGVQRAPTANADEWGRVADVGVALDYHWRDQLDVLMSAAKAVDHRVSFTDDNISTCRVYVAATWHFN